LSTARADNNGDTDTFFGAIAGMLTDREGMMIDGTQDPVGVYNKLGEQEQERQRRLWQPEARGSPRGASPR